MKLESVDKLRALACELREIKEHNADWLRMEAVALVSAADAMEEAAEAILELREGTPGRGECEMKHVKFVDAYEVFECSACGDRALVGLEPRYCPSCGRRVREGR